MSLFPGRELLNHGVREAFLQSKTPNFRPRYPISFLPGRRSIHLVHEIYTPGPRAGLERLARKKLPDASNTKLRIVDARGRGPILRLSDVQSSLSDGHYLEKQERSPSEDPAVIAAYRISKIPAIHGPPKPVGNKNFEPINFVRAGRGKEVHFTTDLNVPYYRSFLTRSYNFINMGCRVEMHLRISKADLKAKPRKDFNGIVAENPHYRPEIILQGMPPGASIMYGPFYDKRLEQLIWVMANDLMWTKKSVGTGHHRGASLLPTEAALNILEKLPVIE
ncbi:MAG: hypothetical protein Q9211_003203 [Gyalolechia sp. 1 TL-2023]